MATLDKNHWQFLEGKTVKTAVEIDEALRLEFTDGSVVTIRAHEEPVTEKLFLDHE